MPISYTPAHRIYHHRTPHVHRYFLPVGQGAFYAECFHGGTPRSLPINIVYDCGTITGTQQEQEKRIACLAQQAVGSTPPGEQKIVIHAIFISHFHKDHIDGIPTLLKYYDVRRIYFPFLEPENKALMKIWYKAQGVNDKEFSFRFLENPREVIDTNVQLFAVGDNEDRRQAASLNNVDFHINGAPIGLAKIDDTTESFLTGSPFDYWEYVPFNIENDQFVSKVKHELQKAFPSHFVKGKALSGDKLEKLYKKRATRQTVINAFTKTGVSKEVNTNSMVVFSGICDATALRQTIVKSGKGQPRPLNRKYRFCPAGCLFTGDYNAKGLSITNGRICANRQDPWLELYRHYRDYWPYIGCIQIPHHGSNDSFNPIFLSISRRRIIYAISAKSNSTKHPGQTVKDEFIQKRKEYFLATEYPNSMLKICIK